MRGIKRALVRVHWTVSAQFGIDVRRFLYSVAGLPAFFRDLRRFRQGYSGVLRYLPCLHDRFEEGGSTRSEYFWQDLLVARRIREAGPEKHVDVGSRVDGFVAHVASFRDIEVFDVRAISTNVPGVVFRQADFMQGKSAGLLGKGYCDSLSCLHALEHFGLGRYGDAVDPRGHERGLENMAGLLKLGGTFYLSVPIGRERVEFNAHRVFDPRTIVGLANKFELSLRRLDVIESRGGVRQSAFGGTQLRELAEQTYNLGLFTFVKSVSSA